MTDSWSKTFEAARPEEEYAHLWKLGGLPSSNIASYQYQVLASQCDYAAEGWLLEMVRDLVDQLAPDLQEEIYEHLDNVNVNGKHVVFGTLGKKIILNIVLAWLAIAVMPYGKVSPAFSDAEKRNVAWFCGLAERIVVGNSIQWRALVDMLRRGQDDDEEDDPIRDRIHRPGWKGGQDPAPER